MARRRLLVTGGSGRLGRLLQHCWHGKELGNLAPVFLGRQDWDILGPSSPCFQAGDIVLDLAGVVRGDFELNPEISQRVAILAAEAGAELIHMSSAAVYRGGSQPMREDDAPNPHSPYGLSKLRAERVVFKTMPSAHVLRLANVAGADALLTGLRTKGPLLLDPVPGQTGGPIRSYIGPLTFAKVMAALLGRLERGEAVPSVLNIAQPGPLAMADLLDADGHPWNFGPTRDGVLAKMELSTDLLQACCDLPFASASGVLAELRMLGEWP